MSLLFFLFTGAVHAQSPISADSLQLHRLVENSEKQIEALKEIIGSSKRNNQTLEQASQALKRLTEGMDQTLDKHQGSTEYNQALLALQRADGLAGPSKDARDVRKLLPPTQQRASEEGFQKWSQFQKQTVQANHEDLRFQQDLRQALQQGAPGFVPKIAVEAQLGGWAASTRISAQITELTAAVQALREEMRLIQAEPAPGKSLGTLIRGSNELNQKLRESRQP